VIITKYESQNVVSAKQTEFSSADDGAGIVVRLDRVRDEEEKTNHSCTVVQAVVMVTKV